MTSKNIIITGTSRGIGFALTEYLLNQEHRVLAISRNSEKLIELAKKYPHLSVMDARITEEEDLNKIVNFVSEQWKQVNVLIHNAGRLIHKPFQETSSSDFLEVYKVNVFAVANLTKLMLPFLKERSHVIALSSMGGIQGSMKFAGLSAYSSSKGALITLMELLAEEYKSTGISFNTLALGAVQTEMLQEAFPDYQAPVSAEKMAKYIANFSLTGQEFYNGKVLQVANTTP